MGVEGTLEIPANDAFKSNLSPIVLPLVSVITNLVDEVLDD